MLYDPKIATRAAREKRRLNALKRVEQIDKIIAELDGTAPGSAGWVYGVRHTVIPGAGWPSWLLKPGEDQQQVKVKHCLVGAVELHVPEPRSRFYAMLAKCLPDDWDDDVDNVVVAANKKVGPCNRLMAFNDEQETFEPILTLLRKARAHQAQLAGLEA